MKSTTSGGVGFFGALTLLFIGLKLCGVISWSWLWVLSPLWIPVSLVVATFALIAFGIIVFFVVAECVHNYRKRRTARKVAEACSTK